MHSAEFRTIREFVGLTAADVATHCGVEVSEVQQWERPGQQPSPEAAMYVYSALLYFNEYAEYVLDISARWRSIFEQRLVFELEMFPNQESYGRGAGARHDWPENVYTRLQGYLFALTIGRANSSIYWSDDC